MTWGEFRKWAWLRHKWRLPPDSAHSSVRYVVWTKPPHRGRTLTGSGHFADYGVVQQRRLSVWLRTKGLINTSKISAWLDAAELHADGWLVNDGAGIRWIADPEKEAYQLVARGFVAVRCGL